MNGCRWIKWVMHGQLTRQAVHLHAYVAMGWITPKKAAWIGGFSRIVYMTGIEFLDAHSDKWGWSWGDIAANITGSGLFISQEVGWEEQRIQFKFSFHRNTYTDSMLNERSDDLFGERFCGENVERL